MAHNKPSNSSQALMPTIFVSHGGGPIFSMDLPGFLQAPVARLGHHFEELGNRLKPKAVVVISAHWEEDVFAVMGHAQPSMLYDYYGFPEASYQINYPAPGAPGLAARIAGLLTEKGLANRTDYERGFDHGVFVPFMKIYPDADIPILQVSLRADLDVSAHWRLGEALAPLRAEGVLLLGSGMIYHNLRRLGPQYSEASAEFEGWLTKAVCDADPSTRAKTLQRWVDAPQARFAHPREEHLMPLFVVAAAAGQDQGIRIFHDHMFGVASASYQFGSVG